ncbi:protein RALF-like 9 [Eutrema salsugineum]|uniref:protein RALF-like 9 n=1 Tax=Eutrema salsugineum TaxID=72664 RepID=UPI000CED229C|nr:protein RALF-like 9 [Eutrema salsugineum]
MAMSKKLIKAVILYMALIMVFFTLATIKTNAQIVISYDALRADHAWGCNPKYPETCVKQMANP